VAWLMMSALTVAVLTLALAGRPNSGTRAVGDQRKSLRAVLDLPPMFLGASAIRALLGAGLTLHGGFVEQLGGGSVFAAALNNLPAAAAVHATGATGRWAAVLAMAIGSNLLVTGSSPPSSVGGSPATPGSSSARPGSRCSDWPSCPSRSSRPPSACTRPVRFPEVGTRRSALACVRACPGRRATVVSRGQDPRVCGPYA